MRDINQIVQLVKENEENIVNNLDDDSIPVYNFLQNEFKKGNVSLNYLFQFVYRSFYRLDSAGLTDELKKEYFKIMEEERYSKAHSPKEIVMRLYNFKCRTGYNSVQFSFTTKLINTIDKNYPIYDSEVANVFKFPTSYIPDVQQRITRYLGQQNIIINVYNQILENNLLESTFKLLDNRFKENGLPSIKKLDFIIWSCGKLI